MNAPEPSSPPKQAELRPNQVPWGAPKSKPPAAPASSPPAAASLSAKKVPWGSRKASAPAVEPPSAPPADSTVTHMPWAEPTPPPSPPPPPAVVSARKVPWSWRKSPKPTKPAEPAAPTGARFWALPKGAKPESEPAAAQGEMEFTRELRAPDDNEPTAEQIVAFLSRLKPRQGEPAPEVTPQAPYKARPISFEPTRWEIILLWAQAHRRRLSLGAVLLVLALSTAYLMRLVSLNAQIDREWRTIETALRARYALVPGYVDCILVYGEDEHYALAMAQRGLAAWRNARTEPQLAAAAVQMERVMNLLTKIMNRYDQFVPLKDPDQEGSSQAFRRLERQRERSRRETTELVRHYNAVVVDFNGKVEAFPGSLLAWPAQLHRRSPIFSSDRN